MKPFDTKQIWAWLADVPDPEIPVISVVDLGVIRDVSQHDDGVTIGVSPTYSGCPATQVISRSIIEVLRSRGVANVDIATRLSPPWTTDWISKDGLAKLAAYGIAPPSKAGGPKACPQCGGDDLERVSQFGSTPCKAQWRCRSCLEPFDYFKCI